MYVCVWQSISTSEKKPCLYGALKRSVGYKAPVSKEVHPLAAATQRHWSGPVMREPWDPQVMGPVRKRALRDPRQREGPRAAGPRPRGLAICPAGSLLTFGPRSTPARSPEASEQSCWDSWPPAPHSASCQLGKVLRANLLTASDYLLSRGG